MIDVNLQLSESHNNTATNGEARRTGTVLWTEHIPQKLYVPYPWQQKTINAPRGSRGGARSTASIRYPFCFFVSFFTSPPNKRSSPSRRVSLQPHGAADMDFREGS